MVILGIIITHNMLWYNIACTEETLQPVSRQGKTPACALHFRPHPLLAEEKIRRLSPRGIAVELPEPIMQPLPAVTFQEESAPAFAAPVPDSNPPQTRDPEEDLLCIAKTFSYLRESGKAQLTKSGGWKALGIRESPLCSLSSRKNLLIPLQIGTWFCHRHALVDVASVFSVSEFVS